MFKRTIMLRTQLKLTISLAWIGVIVLFEAMLLNDDWSKKIKVANYVYVTQVMNAYYIRVSGLV